MKQSRGNGNFDDNAYKARVLISGEYWVMRKGGAAVILCCTTTIATLSLQVSLISKAGLKSGHLSPQNERGAVRISVIMSMREKHLSILIASKKSC